MSEHSVRLSEVADVLRGTVPATTTPEPTGPKFFGLAELSDRSLTQVRYLDPDIELGRAVYLQTGDIAVALLGRLGESALVRDERAGSVLGRECAVIRLRPHEEAITPPWLYAWTRSSAFDHVVATSTSGTTMPRLSIRGLRECSVPLTELDTQQRLADRLGKFEDALELTQHVTMKLERLRQIEIDLTFDATDSKG